MMCKSEKNNAASCENATGEPASNRTPTVINATESSGAPVSICVIIPLYNASKTILQLIDQIASEMDGYDIRLLLVDDASTDGTGDAVDRATERYDFIRYHRSPVNKGQQTSLFIGLNMIKETCDYVITMDDDLENPVNVIPRLIETIKTGYDIVYAIQDFGKDKSNAAPSAVRRIGSRMRDMLFDSFPGKPPGIKVSAFRIMTYELAKKAARSKKRYFYLSAEILQSTDVKVANITYDYVKRPSGKSSYSLTKLLSIYISIIISYKLKLL